MTQVTSCGRQSEKGFTLVELAIVMIIIGLLIGGILKGQELIANARVTSQVSQVKGIDAAMTTFRDQYNALPGDIIGPTNRLPNCTAAMCVATAVGNGDGSVQGTGTADNPGPGPAGTEEGASAFIHLSAAGVLGGVNPNLATYNAAALPSASIGSGVLTFGYSGGIATGAVTTSSTVPGGHYLVLRSGATAAASASQLISPKTLGNIDRKLDDGSPVTGSVIATGTKSGTGCSSDGASLTPAVPDAYNESLTTNVCGMIVRIQQ